MDKRKFRNTIAKECVGASETKISWSSIYKPWDMATITDRITRSRKIHSNDDSHGLGQWSFLTLQGGKGRKVTIVYVYIVYSTPIDPTKINTAIPQQWTMIHDKLETKESIPSLTISNLMISINKLTQLKHEIIIGINTNKDFTSNSGDIARLCKQCKLIDLISTKYGISG